MLYCVDWQEPLHYINPQHLHHISSESMTHHQTAPERLSSCREEEARRGFRGTEWILLLIVEVNMLFEYVQSPIIKGPLWFMKYSSKVSPGDADAFRCISENLKQTSTDKRLQAATAAFWTMRQTVARWVTSRVYPSPCRSAGFPAIPPPNKSTSAHSGLQQLSGI